MPVINGVYLKDFPGLPSAVTDANIIPIAISGNQIAYRTTVAGIVTDARVTSKLLTGLSVTGSAILATDTILQAFGKVQNQLNGKVSSVGLTMPAAFNVANSPITSAGTLAVTAAGVASQYIRGDGALADFPTTGGGGSSVSYYLNGSVNQGTFVGNTYYEMNKTPVIGAGTDFTINANGYIAQFITDANDPASLLIPAGNWNVEMYFSASSSGGTPSFYVEVYKYNGTTFTLLGSSATTPEGITNGTAIDIYYTSVGIPETVLTITDRLAIRVYVTHSGRTITLHTEDNHLSEIVTTFSNGLTTLNGLTKQAQYFAVGSTGTDFNISSSVDTHTFNIPSASATARGLITTGTQTIAGDKTIEARLTVNYGATTASSIQATSTNANGRALSVLANSTLEPFYVTQQGSGKLATFTRVVGGSPDERVTILNDGSIYTGGKIAIGTISAGSGGVDSVVVRNSSDTELKIVGTTGTGSAVFSASPTFTGVPIFGSSISNGTYTYTLPSATGTLALTSALSSYLPLSGGTLTGPLDVQLSGQTSPVKITQLSDNTLYGAITFNGVTTTAGYVGMFGGGSTNRLFFNVPTGGDYNMRVNNTNVLFFNSAGIQVTGAATFNTGTSVTPNFIIAGGGQSAGGGKGNIRSSDSGGGNYWDFGRDNLTTGDFVLTNLGSSPYFRVATLTGAATFSGALTTLAGAAINSGNGALAIAASATRGVINLGGTTDNFLTFANKAYIGVGSNYMQVLAQSGVALSLVSDASTVLSFTLSTGAATFSSTATSKGLVVVGASGGYTTSDNPFIGLGVSAADTFGAINAPFGDKMRFNAYHGFQWYTSNDGASGSPVSKMILTSGGNVGIGTTSPGAQLEVMSTTGGTLRLKRDDTSVTDNEILGTLEFYTNDGDGPHIASYVRGLGADLSGQNYGRFGALSFGVSKTANTDAVEAMRIDLSGNVGIGTTSPAYQLQLSTDSAAKPSTNTWTIASDSRLKENISPYTKGLSAIMAINPVNYDYNGKAGFSAIKNNIGVIAQDVLEILPESVSTYKAKLEENDAEDTELYNFNSHALTYILINAIKELKAEIDLLKPIIPDTNTSQ